VVEAEFGREPLGFDDPRKIRSFDSAVIHRAGDSEASLRGIAAGLADELCDDLVQPGVVPAGVNQKLLKLELVVLDIKEREACVCAPDIARQDHFSKFLQ